MIAKSTIAALTVGFGLALGGAAFAQTTTHSTTTQKPDGQTSSSATSNDVKSGQTSHSTMSANPSTGEASKSTTTEHNDGSKTTTTSEKK